MWRQIIFISEPFAIRRCVTGTRAASQTPPTPSSGRTKSCIIGHHHQLAAASCPCCQRVAAEQTFLSVHSVKNYFPIFFYISHHSVTGRFNVMKQLLYTLFPPLLMFCLHLTTASEATLFALVLSFRKLVWLQNNNYRKDSSSSSKQQHIIYA